MLLAIDQQEPFKTVDTVLLVLNSQSLEREECSITRISMGVRAPL